MSLAGQLAFIPGYSGRTVYDHPSSLQKTTEHHNLTGRPLPLRPDILERIDPTACFIGHADRDRPDLTKHNTLAREAEEPHCIHPAGL